jgi:hypothetical protein
MNSTKPSPTLDRQYTCCWKAILEEDASIKQHEFIACVCLFATLDYFQIMQLVWWYVMHDEDINENNLVTRVPKVQVCNT